MNNENNNQIIQQEIQNNVNYNKKKAKYWLIPVLVFVTMITSKVIQLTLLILDIKSDFINTLFSTMFYICGFAVIPCIIIAIILSVKEK